MFNDMSKVAELSMFADNLNTDIVNMFMVCDNYTANPYPGVYLGTKFWHNTFATDFISVY
jgi:hypothetical protein